MKAPSLIYVDTSAWWHWLSVYLNPNLVLSDLTRNDVSDMQLLYEHVTADNSRWRFAHSALLMHELHPGLHAAFHEVVAPYSELVPIPLTRSDGRYLLDGSVLHGGKFGGTLRVLLNHSGKDHDEALRQVAEVLPAGEFLYRTKVRAAEFDIEHMEAALECGAEIFVTSDRKTILNRYPALRWKFAPDSVVRCAIEMLASPRDALGRLGL